MSEWRRAEAAPGSLPQTLKMLGGAVRYACPPTIIGVRPERPNSADGPFHCLPLDMRASARQETARSLHTSLALP